VRRDPNDDIAREAIVGVERLIRPYVRRTAVIEVDAADFGLASQPLVFKLEFLQHAGSFKARGAFANRCCATCPRPGSSPPRAAITAPPSPMRR
jgi:threonine dehydratase